MKSAGYMTVTCTLSLLMVAAVMPDAAAELLLGMIAPLAVGIATMVIVERTHQQDPAKLTPLMVKAFGAKMLLFGGYVAAVIGLTTLNPVPFVASFCVYFIALHMTEAWLLRSLFNRAYS